VERGITTASVYLPKPRDWSPTKRARLLAGLGRIQACGLAVGPAEVSARRIRREDWAESWKRHFRPITIASALLVKPSWSKRRGRRGQAVVTLDPGLSFGTGQHPTTRFCLEQLVARRIPDRAQSFLDMGTGSGILAIAAVKLGYRRVEAFDLDPDAVRVARANSRQNGVAGKLNVRRQDLTRLPARMPQFEVVCANLLFDLLLTQKRRIVARVKPNGFLVLAGVLSSQFATLCQQYEGTGLKLVSRRKENEWESGAFFLPERKLADKSRL
ncbi:MAG TPA: 50S ribosomal protein L11 methyltransferase, partial [Candidatus Binatia bacterium]|nr:50S ribosomal protein L11 methyltransferase [Candidatus Binatia bacterium]